MVNIIEFYCVDNENCESLKRAYMKNEVFMKGNHLFVTLEHLVQNLLIL